MVCRFAQGCCARMRAVEDGMNLVIRKGTVRACKGCSFLSRVAYAPWRGCVHASTCRDSDAAWWFERCAVRVGANSILLPHILLPHASERFPSSAMVVQDLAIPHPWSLDRCSHAAVDGVEVESREWGVVEESYYCIQCSGNRAGHTRDVL